ncbi:c-type cytochrome biogenesis protein CcmI [Bauldia sp.]|uniref:c-type cytochrome biogenesis protein CcmI n=1 Tax=Bauldia sp. TaxID=2575872 RepID=UPI003BA8A969
MLFWVIIAVLAVSATLSVLIPLQRSRESSRAASHEVSVYRDQLDEVDRDRDRGLIGDAEAEAARTEIARRLIKADERRAADAKATPSRSRQAAAVGVIVGVPVVAVAFYLLVGSPNMPDAPLTARLEAPTEEQDIPALIAQVETHLAANPDDAEGWEILAPIYIRLGRYDHAVEAYGNVVRIRGSSAERESVLGEAIVRANGGQVTGEAQAAFRRAFALDPAAIGPRFYLALADGQAGRTEEAVEALSALAAEAPPGAPWLGPVEAALANLGASAPTPRGPTAADIEAAGDLSTDDRQAMIEGMVAGLAARLEDEPEDAQGWARLVRSYMVLGRQDDALAALQQARIVLAEDPAKVAVVDAEARAAGVTE